MLDLKTKNDRPAVLPPRPVSPEPGFFAREGLVPNKVTKEITESEELPDLKELLLNDGAYGSYEAYRKRGDQDDSNGSKEKIKQETVFNRSNHRNHSNSQGIGKAGDTDRAINETPSKNDCCLNQSITPAGEVSSPGEGSAEFDTDSMFSDDGEGSGDENLNISSNPNLFSIICDELQSASFDQQENLIAPVLNPMKQDLIDDIMKEFWTIFNHEWSTNLRVCTGDSSSPSSSSSTGENAVSSQANPGSNTNKRGRDGDKDRLPDDGNGNGDPKRPRRAEPPETGGGETANFACPYRKNNPRKYTHRNRVWRSCAMTSFNTVARLKYVSPRCSDCPANLFTGNIYIGIT